MARAQKRRPVTPSTDAPDRWAKLRTAEDRQTPSAVLAQLAQDPDAGVRAAVAFNPRTPPTVLAQLADDSEWSVRARLATRSA